MKTNRISRLVCVLLACLMLLPLVACGKTDDPQTTTTAPAGDTTTAVGSDAVTDATENTDIN